MRILRLIASVGSRTAAARLVGGTLLCAALAAATCSGARAQAPSIRHSPPPNAEARRPLAIEAVLVGYVTPEHIATADVVVVDSDGVPHSIQLTLSRGSLLGEIPGAFVVPPELRYYLQVTGTDGTTTTVPPGALGDAVFSISVLDARGPVTPTTSGLEVGSEWAASSVEVLSPAPDEVVQESKPQIAAIFDPPLDEPWDALVVLDGGDVTDASSVSSDLFVLSPDQPLARGAHRITFSAVTATGMVETTWKFFVLERIEEAEGGETWPPGREANADAPATADGRSEWSVSADYWNELEEDWLVSGRLDAGWAAVAAETTAVESTDVFMPYEEVAGPLLDLYLSGVRGQSTFLITAQHDPVYRQDLEWLVSGRSGNIEAEAGRLFPSLSQTTLDWAVGHGARVSARFGRSTTELVGLRMTEADTLAGFGIYSRFAAAVKQGFNWSDGLSTSLVYLSVFDREGSVSEEQQFSSPLRNSVVAGLVRASRGAFRGELELARSEATGETEGSGTAFRAELQLERDWHNRVSLEYVASEPDYYSAGSFEHDPGEHTVGLSYAFRPGERFSSSGWLRTGRSFDPASPLADDEFEIKAYSRVTVEWPEVGAGTRAYAVARYDRVPYETHDYTYAYGAVGGTWRQGETRLSGVASWSSAHSPDESSTITVSSDLRQGLIPDRWTARAGVRWLSGTGDETDYTRVQYTLETEWDFGSTHLWVEYWLIDRDDRAETLQSYTEHVWRAGVGQDL